MSLGDRMAVMCDGVIQQVGPPRDIFEHPANRFVAGFCGTPPMNFIDGVIQPDDLGVVFTTGEARIPLSDEASRRLIPFQGQDMVLGIRPSRLRCVSMANSGTGALIGTLNGIETLGDRTDATVSTRSGVRLTVGLQGDHRPREGDTVALVPDSAHTQIFKKGRLGRNLISGDLRSDRP